MMFTRIVVLIMALLLAACVAAQPPTVVENAATPPTASATSSGPSESYDFSHPSRSCKVDADCAVKDVGNCCGKYPQCVNKDAPTDPAKVRDQCAAEHRVGMCHVRAIGGCSCVKGQCSDLNPIGIKH